MEQDNGKTSVVSVGKTFTKRSLMIDVLDALNLSFDQDEDDSEIFVQYQGEWFRILFYTEKTYVVVIQDTFWHSAPLDDIDNLSLTHKAINRYNIEGNFKMFYTYRKDTNEVAIHTMHEALWLPQIPDLKQYLLAILRPAKNAF